MHRNVVVRIPPPVAESAHYRTGMPTFCAVGNMSKTSHKQQCRHVEVDEFVKKNAEAKGIVPAAWVAVALLLPIAFFPCREFLFTYSNAV